MKVQQIIPYQDQDLTTPIDKEGRLQIKVYRKKTNTWKNMYYTSN